MTLSLDTSGRLVATTPDGQATTLHPLWLRERLPDARILDERTGQRLIEAADLACDLTIMHVDDDHTVTFSDGFTATLADDWIARILARPPRRDRNLWDGTLCDIPYHDYTELRKSDSSLGTFLDTVEDYGFAIVRGVSTEIDGALDVAQRIGPIRITNWGGLADVKAIAGAYDLTMTPRHLEPHSDNPYRHPVPGYILLHCLRNDADGGASTLVDGFAAASVLRERDPEAFTTLTSTPVAFRYADGNTILENHGTLIATDHQGDVVQIRFSNRTEMIGWMPPEQLDAYYRAREAFWRLIEPASPLTLRLTLQPGDLLMMDNYRLLHGRTGFRLGTGMRHMRQCYMDRDVVGSRRKVLSRQITS
ncbi:gamma-butyrobetaine dioxygenase [Ameyamaea chiangmaiensis NBRC 103196]|uniref:TauD/TfdA family dioxygenase n=1 Tax=Ameyamaea chiangmaiensis TaxID=442969 RepID=A0A850PBC1_9PROT|nr:TauD/TfdA family dioxygenase [Ameyamaea chiangmaiensis]MBS4076055.1 TauD/TfdA family dioxygenase [Ameyamaea chiangmaiensis]NVN39830.1 TauD/TfdA family dioxygenase [Ameyamaea chiangmaiensis]GBQ66853.1 gamma-butyrobetaine dioxygenase [Ameyamaea chiangmaiensis NBRC 103196]